MLNKELLKLLCLLSLVIISGCVSNTPPPPSVLHSDNYSALTSSEQRILPVRSKMFTLEDAVRIGLANSPTYEKQKLALTRAYNTFYQALFNYLPTVDMSVGAGAGQTVTKTRGDSHWVFDNWSKTGNIKGRSSFIMFNGLSREMALLAKYEQIGVTKQALKQVRLTLINAIVNIYYDLVLWKAKIAIKRDDLSFQQQMLEVEQVKYDNNLVTYDQVLNFDYKVKAVETSLLSNVLSYDVQEYALAKLLGLTSVEFPKNIKFQPLDELIKRIAQNYSPLGVEFYLDIAIDQRPDLKESRLALKAARYDLYSAWGKFAPTFTANASYGLNTTDWQYYNNETVQYGITASWDIVKGGFSRIFTVRSNQITLAEKEQDVLIKWIEVVESVRKSYATLQNNLLQEKLATAAVKIAERQRDMVREKFENQLVSITRLNDVQNDLISAQLRQVEALITVYKAKSDLEKASGVQRY